VLNSKIPAADTGGDLAPKNPLPLTELVLASVQSESALCSVEQGSSGEGAEVELPIIRHLPEIIALVNAHDVVVVSVPTGGGKTTQLTQALAREGYRAICTQTTRIAVTSMQPYVESQFGGTNGELVGYKHGRGQLIGPNFKIMICSDGHLLEKVVAEEYFKNYSSSNCNDAIILDEAHVYNLNIEFFLALYRHYRFLGKVPKLIITSATIDADALVRFLNEDDNGVDVDKKIPVFRIEGRQYEITELERGPSRMADILKQIEHGDVLDFYAGIGEINQMRDALELVKPQALVVPLHGKQSLEVQEQVHKETELKKIILATNVAETSLTIKNVNTVINGGLERSSLLDGDEEILELNRNSKGTYLQRMGRTGRTSEGFLINWGDPYHTLSDGHWDMQNVSLDAHVLRLIVAGEDPYRLKFVHDPGEAALMATYDRLVRLGCLDDIYDPTPVGRFAATLPIEPRDALIIRRGMELPNSTPELIEALVDIASILKVKDFRQGSGRSFRDLVPRRFGGWIGQSESIGNLLALEAIMSESNSDTRLALMRSFGIREAAVDEIGIVRETIAERLKITLAPLGVRSFDSVHIDDLVDASSANWADHVFRYVGPDKKGNILYRSISAPYSHLRKLNKYANVGAPDLVTGKPFTIAKEVLCFSEDDYVRLVTQVTVLPKTLLQRSKMLQDVQKNVAEYRRTARRNLRQGNR
jgi:HrpA-like RNA helicase